MEYLDTDKPVNKMQPVVSVCITTYNHAGFIAECLDSVLMQETDFPFEIIVGEDESTDGTREICIQYAEKYPDKIRLFLRSEKDKIYINGNKSGRYNYLENLKAAKGKYIATCDGDDFWTDPLKLQKQVHFLEANPKCFMINHAMPLVMKSRKGWYDFQRLAQVGYLPHASNFMFRQVDLEKYRAALMEFLGAEMCMLYISAKEGMIYHDEAPVSFYRINQAGIYSSLNKIQKIEGELKQLEIINKHFNLPYRVYLNRRMAWTLRYNNLTGNKKMEAVAFKFYKNFQRYEKAIKRRFAKIAIT